MAKRSNTTFLKRQKELARKAKRQEKLERREERKRIKDEGDETGTEPEIDWSEAVVDTSDSSAEIPVPEGEAAEDDDEQMEPETSLTRSSG